MHLRDRRGPRFSDRQFQVFAACVVAGLVIGMLAGSPATWLMIGAVVGAGAIAILSWRKT